MTTTKIPEDQRVLLRAICKEQAQARSFRFGGYFPAHSRRNGVVVGALVRRKLIFKSYRGGYKPTTFAWENRKCW